MTAAARRSPGPRLASLGTSMFVAAVVTYAAGVQPQALPAYLARAGLFALLQLLSLAPLWVLAARQYGYPGRHATLRILAFTLVWPLCLFVPGLPGLHWNWLGKVLEFTWCILFAWAWCGDLRGRLGISSWVARDAGRSVLLVSLVSVALSVLGALLDPSVPNLEKLAFEWTLPGVAEEVLFRGVLLGLLLACFPRVRPLLGVPVGWAFALTSVLFTGVHVLIVTPDLHVALSPLGALAGLRGLIYGWVALRSRSVWPAALLHNADNGVVALLSFFVVSG